MCRDAQSPEDAVRPPVGGVLVGCMPLDVNDENPTWDFCKKYALNHCSLSPASGLAFHL